ncbi:MAG: rhomboid family intramembrane serine protease [Halolamina sp.]
MTLPPAMQLGALPWDLLQRLFVIAALLVGAAVALRLDDGSLADRLRERFVLGVPWGTLVTLLGVLAVYLFVQGGYAHWYRPVVIPFRAWSYFEPLGMLLAGFAHSGPGHLLGNLFGAITLAPIVEYVFGHYPPADRDGAVLGGDGSGPTSRLRTRLDTLRRNPLVRAFVLFPLAVAVVGVLITLFTIGAVIGFSGVVFAFAGFALVRYPLATVLALMGSDLLGLLYNALVSPTTEASGRSAFVTPWWADIAIQGHAIGLLAGVLLGALLLRRRDGHPPPPARLWAGGLLVAASQSLWAVYWYRGGSEYVLYRAVGLGLVVMAATLIVVAVAGPDRRLLQFGDSAADQDHGADERASDSIGSADEDTTPPATNGGADGADELAELSTATSGDESRLRDLTVRQYGMIAIVLVAAVLSGPAVAVNLVSTEGALPGEPETVRGYEITYAEDVENEMVSVIPVDLFGETTQLTTSGVIVSNRDRGIWQAVVPKGRLATNGRATVVVGGVGWRETVTAVRRGWTAVGGDTAYRVSIGDDGDQRTVFTSPAAEAEPRIANQNVSVEPGEESFYLLVSEGNDTVRTALPATNESATVRNVTFYGEGDRIVAVHDGTRVTVLEKETYD